MGDYRYFPDQPAPPHGHDARGPRPDADWGYAPAPLSAPRAPQAAQFIRHGQAQPPRPAQYAPALPPSPPLYRRAPAPPAWDEPAYPDEAAYPDPAPAVHPAYPGPRGYAPPPPPVAPPVWGPEAVSPPPAWLGPQAQSRSAQPPYAHPSAPAAHHSAVPRVQAATLLHGLGAVFSLGLVVLAGGWAWNLVQRDVSGVPVVRALEGPMRVAPETPGGTQAPFQGLAVNQLAGAGQTTEADTIVLAPPPVGLGDVMAPAATATLAPDMIAPSAPSAMPGALGFNAPNALAVLSSPMPRGRDASPAAFAQMASLPVAQAPLAQVPVAQALSTSNDPRAADALAASVAQSVALGLSGTGGRDIDPASIGPGTRLVQLGAYDTAEEARAAWDALSGRFNPLLADRGRVIEAAHSGGSVFYRLRAHGFSDERDARRFCAALVAEQIDCIPVLVR